MKIIILDFFQVNSLNNESKTSDFFAGINAMPSLLIKKKKSIPLVSELVSDEIIFK